MPTSIAVVIPTHNRSHYLVEALDSLLLQTRAPEEIIVIDDASTDDTAELCAKYPSVTYIRVEAKAGLSNARNVGVRATTSQVIAFLDDDDTFRPRAIEAHLENFAGHPDLAVSYARTARMTSDGRPLGEDLVNFHPPEDVFVGITEENFVRVQAAAVSRWAFEQVGGFDANIHLCEDIDFWLRLAHAGLSFRFIPEILSVVRKHSAAMSYSGIKMSLAILEVVTARTQDRHNRSALRANAHYRLGRTYILEGHRIEARVSFLTAALGRPGRLRYWYYFLLCYLPAGALKRMNEFASKAKSKLESPLVAVGISERRWGPKPETEAVATL